MIWLHSCNRTANHVCNIELEFFGNDSQRYRFVNSSRKLNVISSALVVCGYRSVVAAISLLVAIS